MSKFQLAFPEKKKKIPILIKGLFLQKLYTFFKYKKRERVTKIFFLFFFFGKRPM